MAFHKFNSVRPHYFSKPYLVKFWHDTEQLYKDGPFSGLMPYEKWECISTKCTTLLENSTDKDNFYSQKTICNSDLEIKQDYIFAFDNRTSFAVEWGLFCEGEAQMSFLSSSIFLGDTNYRYFLKLRTSVKLNLLA